MTGKVPSVLLIWKIVLVFFIVFYLVSNITAHLFSLDALIGCFEILVVATVAVVFFVRLKVLNIRQLYWLLGASLPLFGFQSYTLYSQLFEYWLVVLILLNLFQGSCRKKRGSSPLSAAVFVYCSFSFLSLLSLPLFYFFVKFNGWEIRSLSCYLNNAFPGNIFYSLSSINELVLLSLFSWSMARRDDGLKLCSSLAQGIAISLVLFSLIGILDTLGFLNLQWYRPSFHDASKVYRLQSVFGNPGWYAQYAIVTLPFILFLMPSLKNSLQRFFVLFFSLGTVGIALVLTASRTSWIIYPVLLFVMLFIGSTAGWSDGKIKVGRKWIVKGVGFALIPIVLIATGILGANVYSFDQDVNTRGVSSRMAYLKKRLLLHTVRTDEERFKVWRESLALGGESPVVGLGYEAYKWQVQTMDNIPESSFKTARLTRTDWDTPHNLFLQLFLNTGVAGLLSWGTVVFLLFCTLVKGGLTLPRAAYGLSILAFHLYGLTQSVTYLPVIFFVFFVAVAFCLALSSADNSGSRFSHFVVMGVAIVFFGYLTADNFQGRKLAERYSLASYGLADPDYSGFYAQESWAGRGPFRWTGKTAVISHMHAGPAEFWFDCSAPHLDTHPITLEVAIDSHVVDQCTFWGPGKKIRRYVFGENSRLELRVSRVWSPLKEGVGNDVRLLGVAVGEMRSADRYETGLSAWEVNSSVERNAAVLLKRFRYAGKEAILDLREFSSVGGEVYLRNDMPYVHDQLPVVRISLGQELLQEVALPPAEWVTIPVPPAKMVTSPFLKIWCSTTWNSKIEGYGDDPRDLSVAVGFLPGIR